ncbi:MAG: OsmC family protein [Planctomycetes bacterium]|nr:OsmC family protein [Planctomycetota bacterium]
MKHIVAIEGAYEGDLRVRAVHGPSGTSVLTDAPRDNEGKERGFSPTDLVATALGTCVLTILGIHARRRGVDIEGARFRTTKEMAAAPLRRIARLVTTVTLPASVGTEDRRALEAAARTCPVTASLHPDIEAAVEFRYE